MLINKFPWTLKQDCVVNKLDEVIYIQKDHHDTRIENITNNIVNKIDQDKVLARELISIIKSGYQIKIFRGHLEDLKEEGWAGKNEAESKAFSEFIILQIESLSDSEMPKFRGRLFEKLVEKALNFVKPKPILSGVAIPINDQIDSCSTYEKCYSAGCFKLKKIIGKKWHRETVDFAYVENENLYLLELKVAPETFDCLTLQTMNKLKYVLENKKYYTKPIKLICISSNNNISYFTTVLKGLVDESLEKQLFSSLEAHSWEEYFQ